MSETNYKLVIKNASENSLAKIHKKLNDTAVYQDIFFSKIDDSVSVPVRWVCTSKTKNVYKTDNPYFTFETIEKHTHELNEYFTDKLERPHIKFITTKETSDKAEQTEQVEEQTEQQVEQQVEEQVEQNEEQTEQVKEQKVDEERERKLYFKKLQKEKLARLEQQLEEAKFEKQKKIYKEMRQRKKVKEEPTS